MPLETTTRAQKTDHLELDLDTLNLDMVSERYRVHLEELQAWFKMTEAALKIDFDYEQSQRPAPGSYKSATKK